MHAVTTRTLTALLLPFAASIAAVVTGCVSVEQMAVNKMSDALASGGTAFSSESDPELARDAAPFSLKLMESLLAENPRHAGLLLAASSGFTQYAYAFVQQDADRLESTDVSASAAARARARGLYLRARDYGLRGLGTAHPGFPDRLRRSADEAVAACTRSDVPLLYWTAASWAAAIAAKKDDARLIADLPLVSALIDRALELDESYDGGAIHSFLITYEMARPDGEGPAAGRARRHLDRAVELSDGLQAGPLVAFAEAVCIQLQDRAEFERLLRRSLGIKVDARPEWRLANIVMQRRAAWLLDRTDELFLPDPQSDPANE